MKTILATLIPVLLAISPGFSLAGEYLKSEVGQPRGYSDGVVTEGGRIVWLAGHLALVDENGRPLPGDVVGQARATFKAMEKTLKRVGGSLKDVTTITVYLVDPRDLPLLIPVRKEFFPDGNFPGSTTIAVANLPLPGMLIEITGFAVIGGK